MRFPRCLWLTMAALLTGGCSTVVNSHLQKEPLVTAYVAGRSAEALEKINDKLVEPGFFNSSAVGSGDEVMWRLEAGMLNFLIGNFRDSIAHFNRAEALITDFDQRAVVNLREVGAESAVLVTNLNALPYRGFCRDRIMYPLIRAFAYLGAGDEEGFRVELFRLRENQQRVLDDYNHIFAAEEEAMKRERKTHPAAAGVDARKVLADSDNRELADQFAEIDRVGQQAYGDFLNPLAIFMSGYGYARDGDFENALVDFERLRRALPGSPLVRRYYVEALRLAGREIPEELRGESRFGHRIGRGSVLVIFANGRGAAFRQVSLYIPIYFPGYATIATTAWPVCEYYPAPFRRLEIESGGKRFHTEMIADMDAIISQEYTRRLPGMIARIVLSTAVKEAGSYAATRAAARADSWAGIAVAIGMALYKVAMNTADTRSWELLPREYQLAEFPMPEDHRIVIAPDGGSPLRLEIPRGAGTAIIYVNAPGGAREALTAVVMTLDPE